MADKLIESLYLRLVGNKSVKYVYFKGERYKNNSEELWRAIDQWHEQNKTNSQAK